MVARLSNRPPQVRWAIYLLAADAIIGLLVLLFQLIGLGSVSGADMGAAFVVALQLVQLALVFAIAIGRRWAVVVYVLWLLWGLVHVSLNLHTYLAAGALSFGWIVVQLVAEAVAVGLLLTPAARAWFASGGTATGGEPAA